MSSRDHHPPCPCGQQLADECMCPNGDPLGSMRITRPAPNPWSQRRAELGEPAVCWRGECRNGCYYEGLCLPVGLR